MKHPYRAAAAGLACSMLFISAAPSLANGWYESRPWQFDTSADKANKSAVLDMIERKKGGYYDGFSTTINNNNYSNTNIGTQINCNNVADAVGNQATNSQVANSPNVDNTSGVDSSATGNQSDSSIDGQGTGHGHGQSGVSNDQDNSGDISSGVTGSDSTSSSGPINTGPSKQGLGNNQDNSGNQHASINDSTACDMTGSTTKGNVKSNIAGPLN